jgi:hypothetical protein
MESIGKMARFTLSRESSSKKEKEKEKDLLNLFSILKWNTKALSHMDGIQKGPFNTFGFIDNKTALAKAVINGKLSGIELIPNYVGKINQELRNLWQHLMIRPI